MDLARREGVALSIRSLQGVTVKSSMVEGRQIARGLKVRGSAEAILELLGKVRKRSLGVLESWSLLGVVLELSWSLLGVYSNSHRTYQLVLRLIVKFMQLFRGSMCSGW
jgi:hypothetical protein